MLFIVVNTIIVMLILEIGLRVAVESPFPPRFFEANPVMGHYHIPDRSGWQRTHEYDTYVKINAQGLRDRTYPYAKPAGVFRILILGDSFVEGFQVAQDATFEARLEAQLNAGEAMSPIEVINGGVSRYGTDNALAFLEHEGLKYEPDLVIYVFYPNDVIDNIEKKLFDLDSSGQLVQHRLDVAVTDQVRGALYDVSYLYRLVLGTSIQLQQSMDNTLIKTAWGRVLPIYRAELLPREADAWTLTGALLDRMQASTSAAGAEWVIVCLPEIFQSEDVLWAEVEQTSETLRRDAPNVDLAARLPEGAYWLDLLPVFRAHAQNEALYYASDGHLNKAGHQLAADEIQAYLIEQELIPR
ncbi:MAG: SGNH/GDSL hydrolase family protein [Chloroflexi bacterium]|nr:SGNH/GDSL hydrolase family protein [Chloroflexota bacterium]